jgi:serine/threonine protein kinase/tetratricopeptide (TPR) repeat protein
VTDLRAELQAALGGAYTLERELTGGGMSHVFVAQETALGRTVVVKVIAPELAHGLSAERFTREVRLAARLQQANIVPVLTAGDSNGIAWYTMPFVRGESLRTRFTADGKIPLSEGASIVRDVMRALAYAHGEGIVHRDIKPDNILLSGGTAVVTDFGIAKALSASRTLDRASGSDSTLTQAGSSLGTPAYMAPEQALGDTVDHRADLYAWGVLAYEVLGGAHPFARCTTAQQYIAAHITDTPRPLAALNPDVPRVIADLVMQCLAKVPTDRPESAATIARQLEMASTPSEQSVGSTIRWVAVAAAFVLAAAGVVSWQRSTRSSATSRTAPNSIAVLPLANVSNDTADVYFADGLTEELTSAVAKLPGIRVVGGTSVGVWKGKSAVDLHEVGSRLRVDQVLEGSVRRAGSRLKIAARLSNTADGTLLWSDSYERGAGEVFAMQAEIARAVAGALRVPLGIGDVGRLARAGTRDTVAHELFLRARAIHLQYGERNIRDAIALYAKATERDPGYAEAWTGQGFAWSNLADEYLAPTDAVPHIANAARRALAIDSTLGGPRVLLATALASHVRATETARAARRGAELAPNDPLTQLFTAFRVAPVDPSAAATFSARARDLDPLAAILAAVHGLMLQMAGRLVQAERVGREAVALAPEFGLVHAILSTTLLREGRAAEALAAAQEGIAGGDKDMSYMVAGMALARLGRKAEARTYLTKLEADSQTRYVIGDWVAKLCLELGDRDAAMSWLERSAAAGSNYVRLIDVDPQFAVLRGNPRFEAVRRKVGLVE